jgi:hypothetical protein
MCRSLNATEICFLAINTQPETSQVQHNSFSVGTEFRCGEGLWRVTDIGSRTIVAIRIDHVKVSSNQPELCCTLSREQAERVGWFNGPPYALAEHVFNEDDFAGCVLVKPA